MNMIRQLFLIGSFVWVISQLGQEFAYAQASPKTAEIDLELATTLFNELDAIANQDGGELWGVALNGPALFVEPKSRAIAANAQIPGDTSKLEQPGKILLGTLPPELPVANTAIRWAEQEWTMIMWPLPTDPVDRRVLMAHESWHRIQAKIPIAAGDEANSHLDSLLARVCLQMEWGALAKALESKEDRQREAILDALVFRTIRRQKYPGAAQEENRMELHEGMAEYTGIRLGAGDNARAYAVRAIQTKPKGWSTLVRSFAYLSGPGYGLLLDEHAPGWRQRLKADTDLGEQLRIALNIELPRALPAHARDCITKYNAQPLVAAERSREEKRIEQQRQLKALLIDGPILVLPLGQMQMSFDPGRNVPVEAVGTVYGNLVVSDSWGKLSSTGKAMITLDYKQLIVPVDADFDPSHPQGADWSLELAKEWDVKPSEGPGKWTVHKSN
jgi:hypothetical protein